MVTNSATIPISGSTRSTTPAWWGGSPARQRFDRFVTGALAAALVVAIAGGAWLAAEGNPFGGGNEPPPTTGVGGFGPEGGDSNRVVPEVTVSADDQMSSIPYPSAAECTVELPTRDWVKNHIQQTIDITEPPASELYQRPIEPTQEEIDGVMSTFRMWQACQLVGAAQALAFTLETPWVTKGMGATWSTGEQPVSDAQLAYLTDIVMTASEEEINEITAAYFEGTPGAPVVIYATPGATPAVDPMAEHREEREYAPLPANATPVARSASTQFVHTIFADQIEMIGPDRARAILYSVSPETGEIQIAGGDLAVELILVDGAWRIDFYGEAARG